MRRALPEVSWRRICAGAEEAVYVVAAFQRDEEELARAGAPLGEELGGGEEERLRVGEGGAEEHGGGAAIDQEGGAGERAIQVEGDGGAVGLVAVEEEGVVAGDCAGGFELLDAGGEVLRGEHGGEADEGDVRGDEEYGGGEGDGGGGGEMAVAGAEQLARKAQATAGPMAKAARASEAGRRRAAKLGPVRSKSEDMERV